MSVFNLLLREVYKLANIKARFKTYTIIYIILILTIIAILVGFDFLNHYDVNFVNFIAIIKSYQLIIIFSIGNYFINKNIVWKNFKV